MLVGRVDGYVGRAERADDAPLYVLTPDQTLAGGQECAYDIQTQKRGTLVGDVMGAGANPVGDHRLDDHFDIVAPMRTRKIRL